MLPDPKPDKHGMKPDKPDKPDAWGDGLVARNLIDQVLAHPEPDEPDET